MRVDLPGENWADIHTFEEMPRRVTVRMEDMLAEIPDDRSNFRYARHMSRMRDTLIAMLIKSWSYDFERTGEAADLLEVPQGAYTRLLEETEPHWEAAGFTTRRKDASEPETTSGSSTSSA